MECPDCGMTMNLDVHYSDAGWFVGYACETCGPYDRMTGYYFSEGQAQEDLQRILDGAEPFNARRKD